MYGVELRDGRYAVSDKVRETRKQKSAFASVRNAEREYAAKLRQIARQVGVLVHGLFHGSEFPDPAMASILERQMDRYAELLVPWAEATARRMLQDVMRRDERAWRALARTMGRAVALELSSAPTGHVLQAALDRQVSLITSLPRDAARRVHELALRAASSGARAGEIRGAVPPPGLAREVLATGHVTIGRANLIARTETSRVASELTAARAQYVGSDGYVWRTANDRDVRPMHRKLDGTFHRWTDPPVAEEGGQRHAPGEFPNCRCWPEPILPEHI